MRYASLLTAVAFVACGLLNAAAVRADPIKIETVKRDKPVKFGEIRKIFNKSCTACHSASKKKGGLSLETLTSILKGGKDQGPAIVPKKPDDSPLLAFASHQDEPFMPPPGNKVNAKNLTPAELGLIKLWIEQGAPGGGDLSSQPVTFQALPPGVNPIFATAISPDGRYVACGRANQIFIYHIPTGRVVCRLTDPSILKGGVYKKPGVAHLDLVQSLAFSPDGRRLASGGFQNFKLWTRPFNSQLRKLSLASAGKTMAVSADGKWLAAVSGAKIQLIEVATGKAAKTLTGHTGPVSAVAFTSDGTKLFSGSADKTVRIWNLADGKLSGKIETTQPIAALTLVADGKQVATGGGDNSIYIWDVAAALAGPKKEPAAKKSAPKKPDAKKKDAKKEDGKPKPLRTLAGHSKPVTSLVTLATANTQILSGSQDGTLKHWDANAGRQIRSMNHGAPVVAVAARPDAQRFASVSSSNTVRLWNGSNGAIIAYDKQQNQKGDFRRQEVVVRLDDDTKIATNEVNRLKAAVAAAKKAAPPKDAAAKKTATALAAAEKTLKAKKTASDKANASKTAAEKVVAQADAAMKTATTKATAAAAALKKDTKNAGLKKAKADADKALAAVKKKLTDAQNKLKATAKPVADATKGFNDAQAAFKNAKRTSDLAAADAKKAKDAIPAAEAAQKTAESLQKKVAAELEVAKKAATATEMPFASVAFSPDNLEFAVGGNDKHIHTYSADTGQPLDILEGHGGTVHSLTYISDKTLASTGADNQLVFWNTHPEWTLERTVGGNSSLLVDRVISLDFSPDGKTIASGGGEPSRSGELKIWDVASGKLIREIPDAHSDTVFGLEFSPDGSRLATGSSDKFVKIFNVADGKLQKSFDGHTHHVLGVSWQFDGKVIASCGADQVIKVWNVETGEQKRTISGFPKQFTAIRFFGNTNQIIAANGSGQIYQRRTDNGGNIRTFTGATDFTYTCDLSYGGRIVVGGGQDSILRVWNGADGKVLHTFEPPKSPEKPAGVAAK